MTLTNPKSESKQFTDAEFFSFCLRAEKTQAFRVWAKENGETSRFFDGAGNMLDQKVVIRYLESIGYKIKQ